MLAEYFPILIFLAISVVLGVILLATGGILGALLGVLILAAMVAPSRLLPALDSATSYLHNGTDVVRVLGGAVTTEYVVQVATPGISNGGMFVQAEGYTPTDVNIRDMPSEELLVTLVGADGRALTRDQLLDEVGLTAEALADQAERQLELQRRVLLEM